MLMACNCEWGCPCSFNAPPTYGDCASALAYRVVEGSFGDVSLDGLRWGLVAYWPGALHELNGEGVVYLDESADASQLDALRRVATGGAGGPIGIFMSTLTAGIKSQVARIEFRFEQAVSRFKLAGAAEVVFEPMRSAVSGDPHEATLELPTGMLTNREHFYSTETFSADAGGRLRFSFPGRNAIASLGDWRGP